MSAPWPYEDVADLEEDRYPSWRCPEGICECSTQQLDEPTLITIRLRHYDGELMPGARCRVLHHGVEINQDQPYADDKACVRVMLRYRIPSLRVEWAPAHTPVIPDYPLRRNYYVDLCKESPKEAARRRLSNLGFFCHWTLDENVLDFQRCYPCVSGQTGDYKDIAQALELYHDDGVEPAPEGTDAISTPDTTETPATHGSQHALSDPASPSSLSDLASSVAAATSAAATSAAADAQNVGRHTGTAQLLAFLPAPDIKIKTSNVYYAFVPMCSPPCNKAPDRDRIVFWVFNDSLKWEVPSTTKWDKWNKYESDDPLVPPPFNRRRMVRLPCTAQEAQRAAKKLDHIPPNLIRLPATNKCIKHCGLHLPVPPGGATVAYMALTCSLFSPKLYDLRFAQASLMVDPSPVGGPASPVPKDILEQTGKTNPKINDKVRAALAGRSVRPDDCVADPGKCWSLSNSLVRTRRPTPRKKGGALLAQNYGFHYATAGKGGEAVWGGHRVAQIPEMGHNVLYKDYSQQLVLVAGWCCAFINGQWDWMATRDAYRQYPSLTVDTDKTNAVYKLDFTGPLDFLEY